MAHDLFGHDAGSPLAGTRQRLGLEAIVLRGFALSRAPTLLSAVAAIREAAPCRHMTTPGGYVMSAALTNCGRLGWFSDEHGYRYTPCDPGSGLPWPTMPDCFLALAREAAQAAGFGQYTPDVCLINSYAPGARMSLHQDKDERDHTAPIVSVSLGIPCLFLFGGNQRGDRPARVPLFHGDVVVWGGADRLRYHGVAPIPEATHPLLGNQRINLTFRQTGLEEG
ncbi:MAG TPA: DNA oxidative demethylase AlkB [Burkholderiaceae bacterium]|nr:DNA oxidative demethylase AlkB [Burkholderiaceae bacterium]